MCDPSLHVWVQALPGTALGPALTFRRNDPLPAEPRWKWDNHLSGDLFTRFGADLFVFLLAAVDNELFHAGAGVLILSYSPLRHLLCTGHSLPTERSQDAVEEMRMAVPLHFGSNARGHRRRRPGPTGWPVPTGLT